MEQIPHVALKPIDVMRAKSNELSKRQQRRHVHGELADKASVERANIEKNR